MKFKFINGRMFLKNQPVRLTAGTLIDTDGAEYVVHCPPEYEPLRFFDMGRSWRVSEVECKKTHRHYLLKNLKDEKNCDECFAITTLQGVLFKDFDDSFIKIPKVVEAGMTDSGANYVIEQQMYGIKATPTVIDSFSKNEHENFITKMSLFLANMHHWDIAAKFIGMLPPKSNPTNRCEWDSVYLRRIYQDFSFGFPLSLIHCDIAPRNVLIGSNPNEISIIDWGSAKCDRPFVEFERAYSDWRHGFGDKIVDEIARGYISLRQSEWDLMKRDGISKKPTIDEHNHHARPTLVHRLPKYLKKKQR